MVTAGRVNQMNKEREPSQGDTPDLEIQVWQTWQGIERPIDAI
jgi:hypothetical protein